MRTQAIRARPLGAFCFFLALGVLGTLALTSFSPLATALSLLGVLGILLTPAMFSEGLEKIISLVKSLRWWHGLWLILFLSELSFRSRGDRSISQEVVDSSAAFRIALVSITALVLAVRLALRQTSWLSSLCRGLVGTVGIYALICLISTLWSVYPSWTLYKSLEYLCDVCLLAATLVTIRSVASYKTFLDWTWTLYTLLLLSVWLGALLWPQEAFQQNRGLFGHELYGVFPLVSSNSVGEFGAILAVIALSRLLLRSGQGGSRIFYSLGVVAALATVVVAQGRSAVTGLLLALPLVLFFSKRVGAATLIVGAGLSLFLLGGAELFSTYFMRGQDAELFRSLSGRVPYWEFSWHELMKRPWTGYGAFTDRFVILAKLGEGDTSSVHNTYVAVLVGTSFWGVIPIVVALIGVWWLLIRTLQRFPYRSTEYRLAVEALAVLAIVTVRSFFTINLVWHVSAQFLVILGYAEFLRRQQPHFSYRSNRTEVDRSILTIANV